MWMRTIKRRTNSVMSRFLAERSRKGVPPDKRLSRHLTEGVVEREGFVLLKTEKDSAGGYNPDAHFDETGYECLVNHIHIDPKRPGDSSALDIGLAYADRLVGVLQTSGYPGRFRVVLSYDLEQKICTVRFHRVRQGQIYIDENALEDFKEEGVLVINC